MFYKDLDPDRSFHAEFASASDYQLTDTDSLPHILRLQTRKNAGLRLNLLQTKKSNNQKI